MTYPLVNIRQQLTLFLARKILRYHVENGQKERMIPKQCSISTMEGFGKDLQMMIAFFTKEHANTHLGLIINMDWFQPFDSSLYSVEVIYALLCNLPLPEHYKTHNIL